jgi:GNAT superfamily N-acetyltransferase
MPHPIDGFESIRTSGGYLPPYNSEVSHTSDDSGSGDQGAPAVLDDGTSVLLRPAGHDDGPAILDGFARCSADTRYFRFLSGGYQLTDERLNELIDADHRVHAVWLALDRNAPGTPVAALARFVRSWEEPDVAEVAFIVADDYQGRGIGRLLLDALRVSAAVDGVTTFVANTLAENRPMLALLLHRGAYVVNRDGPELRIRMPLDSPELATIDPGLDGALRDRAEAAAAVARAHERELGEEP